MSEVRNWAKKKSPIIKIMAPHLALCVEDFHEDFQNIKSRRFNSQRFPLPHLPSWFAMYRSHRKTLNQVKAVWSAMFGKNIVQSFSKMYEDGLKSTGASEDSNLSPEKSKEIKQALQSAFDVSQKFFEKEVSRAPMKASAQKRLRQLVDQTPLETSFYVFVVVPCWALYRTSPTMLYRKARLGDFEAMEKLLRLDQLMLHDPAIGSKIIKRRFEHSTNDYRRLISFALESPKRKTSRVNILLSIAGFIYAFSQIFQQPLTSHDIVELFKAVDEDTKSKLREELPKDYDNLRRNLESDRNLWRQVFT
jgi:hypothetical protein